MEFHVARVGENIRMSVRLSENDKARAQTLFEDRIGNIPEYFSSKVFVNVSGYGKVGPYVRALPGRKPLGDALGKQLAKGVGTLIGVGFQAFEDRNRQDLSGSQKLGRTSLAILDVLPPLGLAHFAADMIWPGKWDRATAYAFSAQAPWVDFISDQMVRVGGKRFQLWSLKPCWIDFF